MVKLLRIDDRLIHGQVAFSWTKYLGVNCILIANDSAINDEFKKMSLNLAKPPGIKLILLSVEDAVNFLNSEDSNKYVIFAIVDSSLDALRLCEQVSDIKSVNAGGIRMGKNKKMISPAIAVDKSDIETFGKLISMGVEVEVRQVPTEKKKSISDLIR